MRFARLILAVVGVIVATGLLVAPTAAAQPPLRLQDYVTDQAGVLSPAEMTRVEDAVDRLYADRNIRLWVVYVDTFGQDAGSWAQRTSRLSELGNYDAILAVAVDGSYAFQVPDTATALTASQIDDLRRTRIEPALRSRDWGGAAVAAAEGLNTTGEPVDIPWASLLVVLGVIALLIVALILVMRWRRRRRRAAELEAAQRVDPTDPNALARLSVDALDDLSKSIVVAVDNAVRTSQNELALAVEEFGAQRTQPFTAAVEVAKTALVQAFTVRQQLDDAVPETPEQRRDLLTRVIVAAGRADRELDAQVDAFEQMRDLVLNAPARLDTFTQQLVDLTARIGPSEQALAALHTEFDDAALVSVAGNVASAQERMGFAERNIARARELAAKPVAGRQSELVDAVRAAESGLAQAASLLDAVGSAGADIRHAAATLPSTIADIQAGIVSANAQLAQSNTPHATELTTARDAATTAVTTAQSRGAADPLGVFTQLTQADAALDRLLAEVAQEREAAERLQRAYEQALFAAQSRVRAVSDYIDTRRGTVGPEARTRLAEAVRQLQAAQDKGTTNPTEAIAHANGAATLAARAQSLANDDVMAAQRTYANTSYRGGPDMGAMIGGLVIGNILSGAMRGGSGWNTTSFGGSSRSSGPSIFGGSGRF